MYAVNATALPLSPTTPQASVASMIVPQVPALGSLPPYQVAQPIPNAEIRNPPQGKKGPAKAEAEGQTTLASPQQKNTGEEAAARLTNSRITSYPSLFLAQLISQGMGKQVQGLVSTYESLHASARPRNEEKRAASSGLADSFSQALATHQARHSETSPETAEGLARNDAPVEKEEETVDMVGDVTAGKRRGSKQAEKLLDLQRRFVTGTYESSAQRIALTDAANGREVRIS